MEFVATSRSTSTWLRFDQTVRNLTSGGLGIPLVVSRLGVAGLKKTSVVYLLDSFEGRGQNGQCDLVWAEHPQMIGPMVAMLMSYSLVVNVALVLWGLDSILRNGYGI